MKGNTRAKQYTIKWNKGTEMKAQECEENRVEQDMERRE
jgi:hypothetical protein